MSDVNLNKKFFILYIKIQDIQSYIYSKNIVRVMKKIKNYFQLNQIIISNIFLNFVIIWQCSYGIFINWRTEIYESQKYINLAKNTFTFTQSATTSYRIGIPLIAKFLNRVLHNLFSNQSWSLSKIHPDFTYSISFYLINLFISILIFFILYRLLEILKVGLFLRLTLIYLIQLNSTYLNMIALPNADIGLFFFLSLMLLISVKPNPQIKTLWLFFLIALLSIFFKEYIFLAALPSFIGLIKRISKSKFITNISVFFYLSFLNIALYSYKKIFDSLTYPYSTIKYETYTKHQISNLIYGILHPQINLSFLQDFLQYNPIIILLIMLFSLTSRNFVSLLLRYKYFSFLPLIIFTLLSGSVFYPIRIFYPFYIYTLLFLPYSPIFINFNSIKTKDKTNPIDKIL